MKWEDTKEREVKTDGHVELGNINEYYFPDVRYFF